MWIRTFCVFVVGLSLLNFSANGQFVEDFSDGDFTNNPTWTSSNESETGSDFQVTTNELQSKGPSATATLWISNSNVGDFSMNETTWEFRARYTTSGPSGSNNIRVYLTSDQVDLTASPQGYYIQLGEGGSGDGIDFFKTSSSSALISDPNPSVAASIDVNVRVTRTSSGEWTLEADPTGGTSFTTIGTVNDTEFTSGSSFGFVIEHSSTRNEDFFFDDISVSSIDNTPPQIVDIQIVSNTEIDVQFSENLDQTTAENINNYTVDNGIGNPAAAVLNVADESIVHLTFATTFASPSNNELTVENVEDENGNAIVSESMEFFYFQEIPAAYKDVLITEFLADPTPPNDLPEAEFIELFNNSNKTFDLQDWTFSDATSSSSLPNVFLGPGEYVIVCAQANESEFASFGEVISLSSFPTLNNSGDQLSIYDDNSTLIDSLAYTTSWYNDEDKDDGGWTLELIDPSNSCGEEENWTASNAPEGGTPGIQNSVFDDAFDTNPPFIESTLAISADTVPITFNQRLDPSTVQLADFSIDQGVSISTINFNGSDMVELVLTTTLESNTTYNLEAVDVSDCSGNIITSEMAEIIFIDGETPNKKDIIFSEIMAKPSPPNDLPEVEYIELFNRSNKVFDLTGWHFSDAVSSTSVPTGALFPGGYLVLCPIEGIEEFQNLDNAIGLQAWPSLNDGGDQIALHDGSGALVDSVSYDNNWYNSSDKQSGGWSLEIIDPNNECGEADNWIGSENAQGGTPGLQNSVLGQNPDLLGPKLIQAVALENDELLLRFDETLDPVSVSTASYEISPAIAISSVTANSTLKHVSIGLSGSIESNQLYTISIKNLTDCTGNIIDKEFDEATFGLIEQAEAGDVIINEILFDPRSGGEDFLEIYNKSEKYINLNSWVLANGEVQNDTLVLDTERVITEGDVVLAPEEYLVLTDDRVIIKEQYPLGKESRFFEMSSLPTYPNESGLAALISGDQKAIDFFQYTTDYHSPLLDEVEGVSLERVSFSGETNVGDNWKSAVASVGFATPGYENSQSRANVSGLDGAVTVDPKVIVPDGSGRNDFATISYEFDAPGNVGTVKILDIKGRLVKEITNNNFLGVEGFFTWDGTTQDGEKARIGYYLVLFEIFGVNGNAQTFKEKVVVGSRF